MEKGYMYGKKEINIWDNGSKIKEMEKVPLFGQMEIDIEVDG